MKDLVRGQIDGSSNAPLKPLDITVHDIDGMIMVSAKEWSKLKKWLKKKGVVVQQGKQ